MERKHEAVLDQGEARYRHLFDAIGDAVLIVDPQTAEIVDANRGAETYYGYSRAELLGLSVARISAEPAATLAAVVSMAERAGPFTFGRLHRRRSGETFPAELTGSVLVENGRPLIIAVVRDVSERERAAEALHESREFLENAQGVARIGSWVHLIKEGRLVWSRECCRIMGVEPGEARGVEAFYDALHPDDRQGALLAEAQALKLGASPYALEFRVVRADGAICWVRSRASVVRDAEGRPQKMIGVVKDVTEAKEAGLRLKETEDRLRQAQKMEAVGRLAGGIAHDFNNILTAIKGYGGFLRDALEPGSPMRADVEEIEKAADRAAALTHQLLAFSRKQVLQPEVLDVNGVVRGLESMMRRLTREDIEVVIKLKDGLGLVLADPGQMSQVVMNLIVNARDAMPGGGTLTIETADVAGDSCPSGIAGVMLSVADTGVGMDARVLPHIFEPFFTTKGRGHGTGLGLATVYGIVEQSGGCIVPESEPGRGSTFRIYMPRVEGPAAVKAQLPAAGAPWPRSRATVLVVEDEALVRRLICRTLAEQGCEVLAAADSSEALSLCAAHAGTIDLVLTDVIMPGMNGRALAELLVSRKPGMRVLYMSGYTDDVIAHHGVLEPGMPLLQKPFDPGALTAKVREVLARAV